MNFRPSVLQLESRENPSTLVETTDVPTIPTVEELFGGFDVAPLNDAFGGVIGGVVLVPSTVQ